MSKAMILTVIMLGVIAALAPIASGVATGCTQMDAVSGDTITLRAPIAPTGVNYNYIWTVDSSDSPPVHLVPATTDSPTSITFTIPATGPASSYTATLSVESVNPNPAANDPYHGKAGCILQNCVQINVQSTFTCGISGLQTVCISDTGESYTYTGSADISNKKTAYLIWKLDSNPIVNEKTKQSNQGTININWNTAVTTSGVHHLTVEVHSAKTDNLLQSCASYDVMVLPLPVATISPS